MSRDWLKTSSASLSKLEQVATVRYDVNVQRNTEVFDTKSKRKPKTLVYTELETNPPLSSLTSQKTIWGSSSSISELIQKQEERQRRLEKKPPRRPWSGKKTTPSVRSRKEKETSNHAVGPKISVLGAQYQPQSRPPSGRPRSAKLSSRSTGHGEFISQKEREDLLFEEFIQCQQSGMESSMNFHDEGNEEVVTTACHGGSHMSQSSQGKTEENKTPSPRSQHDKDSQSDGVLQTSVHQSPAPQLLRKPTPEPLRLSMTLPQTSEWIDGDNVVIDSDCSSLAGSDDDDEKLELQSVTSEMSTLGINCLRPLSPNLETHVGVTFVSVTPRDVGSALVAPDEKREISFQETDQSELTEAANDDQVIPETEHKQRTEIVEVEESDVRRQTELPDNSREDFSGKKENVETEMKYKPKPPRPRSSKPKGRSRLIPKVELDYGEENTTVEKPVKHRTIVTSTAGEVETMMSRLAIAEGRDGQQSENKTELAPDGSNDFSEYGKRTFQMSSSSFNQDFSEIARKKDVSTETKLTTKTVEFSPDGIRENVTVSVLKNTPEHDRKTMKRFAPNRRSEPQRVGSKDNSDASTHGPLLFSTRNNAGSDSQLKTHGAITRPMMIKSVKISERPDLSRPGSRMSHREDESPRSDGENGTSAKKYTPPSHKTGKSQRPRSAISLSKNRSHGQQEGQKVSPSVNLHSNSARTITPQTKRSSVEVLRNREAARALREGALTSTRKYVPEEYRVEEVKPVSPSRVEPPSDSDSSSSDDDFDFPKSQQEERVFQVRHKLRQNGVQVPFKTLKRGLMSPSERGFEECMSQLPQSTSASLLNQPEAWLGEVFRKYKLAERALQRANERMADQLEMEAKAAAARAKEASTNSGKTKKKTKKRKHSAKRKTRQRVKSTAVT